MNKLVTTILPSLLVGAFVFGSPLTQADDGRPTPPTPPTPPRPPHGPHVDVQIDMEDIDEMVDENIRHALEAVGNSPHVPAHVRDNLKKRLEKVRIKLKKRLAKVNPRDIEALGEELGKMGEEIGAEMEAFGKEMEKWGEQFGKDFEKKMKVKVHKGFPGGDVDVFVLDDDDDDVHGTIDPFGDDDLDDAMRGLSGLKLAPQQREALRRLRADSDARVARAKAELDRASEMLRQQLENGAGEAEISRSIDLVTKHEADIRKARILAWVKARDVLDPQQQAKVRGAVKGRTR